jgi:hypothetical protein
MASFYKKLAVVVGFTLVLLVASNGEETSSFGEFWQENISQLDANSANHSSLMLSESPIEQIKSSGCRRISTLRFEHECHLHVRRRLRDHLQAKGWTKLRLWLLLPRA